LVNFNQKLAHIKTVKNVHLLRGVSFGVTLGCSVEPTVEFYKTQETNTK